MKCECMLCVCVCVCLCVVLCDTHHRKIMCNVSRERKLIVYLSQQKKQATFGSSHTIAKEDDLTMHLVPRD